ncbi:uncharacterized protein BJ171DRAFT_424075 [Polychytrium aggregatum]|uniref:uncharacterized protein n=1 Tax=Polychytrium aggregatum TaxID=110093 RepID=UPI0022FE2F3E|nr:uncharacterized protein BJ171DRAFT_424075 [Polychytrium aggregatum]KAI9204668.1 hypothetical protein BJ171DRAFT_424075 [Polychytrium aggregatum]
MSYVNFGADPKSATKACPQPPVRAPSQGPDITRINVEGLFKNTSYWHETALRLSRAVQIPTVSYDDMVALPAPGEPENKWKPFLDFHDFLEQEFPLLHKSLKREVVNKYALIYTWDGTNPSLKPIMLTAHMDVVPVAESSIGDWLHPPFAGVIQGGKVWGRGSYDNKNALLCLMEAVEALLAVNFQPTRTIIMAFGYDEEITLHGARNMGYVLLGRYGRDSIEFVLDEGTTIGEAFSRPFGLIATTERGHSNAVISVATEGGHSSQPPPHTSIGILSEAIVRLEAHPYTPRLEDSNPFVECLRCWEKYGTMEHGLSALIRHMDRPWVRAKLVDQLAQTSVDWRNKMVTSQAADVISGGTKVNALPEEATVMVNYRIAMSDSVSVVEEHLIKVLRPVVTHHNLTLEFQRENGVFRYPLENSRDKSWYDIAKAKRVMKIRLEANFEPSPIASTHSLGYSVLGGTMRHVFDPNPDSNHSSLIIAPTVNRGNTDTRHYVALAPSAIYRFRPSREGQVGGMHSVNEFVTVEGHVEGILFYHELIRNWNEV